MFASLISDLYASSAHLIATVYTRLSLLFKRPFHADIAYYANTEAVAENAYIAHIAASSLPSYVRDTPTGFEKVAQGYLSADEARTTALHNKLLGTDAEILIGLS